MPGQRIHLPRCWRSALLARRRGLILHVGELILRAAAAGLVLPCLTSASAAGMLRSTFALPAGSPRSTSHTAVGSCSTRASSSSRPRDQPACRRRPHLILLASSSQPRPHAHPRGAFRPWWRRWNPASESPNGYASSRRTSTVGWTVDACPAS